MTSRFGKARQRIMFTIDDGTETYSRSSMIRENSEVGVPVNHDFLLWLCKARPGQQYRVPIGGGWTVVRAVRK